MEINWRAVHCDRWIPYDNRTGSVVNVLERRVPGKKKDREDVRLKAILSQIDAIYKSS